VEAGATAQILATGVGLTRPAKGDPLITFYTAKGGKDFNLFSNPGSPNTNIYYTPINQSGGFAGLSHMGFYDTGDNQVGEPPVLTCPGILGPLATWEQLPG
jgi:hypothetical protein